MELTFGRRCAFALVFVAGAVELWACSDGEVVGGRRVAQGGTRPDSLDSRAIASPTPCPAGKLCGSTDAGQTDGPTSRILSIRVEPATLSLNSPPIGGQSANFVSSGQLTAQVSVSGEATTSVTWSSSATAEVSVDPTTGLVTAQPGARAGIVEITATSVADPSKSAKALVNVTTNGVVAVGID